MADNRVQLKLNVSRISSHFSEQNKLVFRDADNMKRVLLDHRLHLHEPGQLCAAGPSALLYQNMSAIFVRQFLPSYEEPDCYSVYWLDCASTPLKRNGVRRFRIRRQVVVEFCFIEPEVGPTILVLFADGVFLYRSLNSEPVMEILNERSVINPCHVACDGAQFFFLCDQVCEEILMFSLVTKESIGSVSLPGVEEQVHPRWLAWSNEKSVLLVGWAKGDEFSVSHVTVNAVDAK